MHGEARFKVRHPPPLISIMLSCSLVFTLKLVPCEDSIKRMIVFVLFVRLCVYGCACPYSFVICSPNRPYFSHVLYISSYLTSQFIACEPGPANKILEDPLESILVSK